MLAKGMQTVANARMEIKQPVVETDFWMMMDILSFPTWTIS